MLLRFVVSLGTLLALCAPALADTCPADITHAQAAVKAALARKPDRYRGKFDLQQFNFVFERTPIEFATPAPGETWITRGSNSSVDVNAARFCSGLSPKEQARWLFHGYLDALGVEPSGSTAISETFKTFEELTAFVCDLSFYLLNDGNAINTSAITHPTSVDGYGEELADAWNEAMTNAGSAANGDYVDCYEIGYRPGSYGDQVPYCAVRANFANSCQRTRQQSSR